MTGTEENVGDFLDNLVTDLRANFTYAHPDGVTGQVALGSAERRPEVRLDLLAQHSVRLPTALVINRGGLRINEHSEHLDMERIVDIAIAHSVPRDPFGEATIKYIDKITDALKDRYEYNSTFGLFLASEGDEEAITDEATGTYIIAVTHTFTYEIRRSAT